jgi:hypothetical protein
MGTLVSEREKYAGAADVNWDYPRKIGIYEDPDYRSQNDLN